MHNNMTGLPVLASLTRKGGNSLERLEKGVALDAAAFDVKLTGELHKAMSAVVGNAALFDITVAAEFSGYVKWADVIGDDPVGQVILGHRLEQFMSANDVVGNGFAARSARGFE